MTENAVEYAYETAAKNAAHTAIQIAMQNMNADENWAENHEGASNAWETTIDGAPTKLYTEYIYKSSDYWQADSLRLISKATYANNYESEVVSVYLKAPFSNLVPPFGAALQFPTGYGSLTADGTAHAINGQASHCEEDKPPIITSSQETKDDLDNNDDLNVDGEVALDSTLNYEPTDELIERLSNSGNAITVTDEYSGSLGTADDPGVFFIEGNVKLTGQQSEGYGIMVIRESAYMEYEDEENNTLDIRGNFEFNGLVIFENASLFDGRGTPTINGSVLVGETEDNVDPIDIELGGNIEINYDCDGENYARMSAADAVKQNKYTRVVTYE